MRSPSRTGSRSGTPARSRNRSSLLSSAGVHEKRRGRPNHERQRWAPVGLTRRGRLCMHRTGRGELVAFAQLEVLALLRGRAVGAEPSGAAVDVDKPVKVAPDRVRVGATRTQLDIQVEPVRNVRGVVARARVQVGARVGSKKVGARYKGRVQGQGTGPRICTVRVGETVGCPCSLRHSSDPFLIRTLLSLNPC